MIYFKLRLILSLVGEWCTPISMYLGKVDTSCHNQSLQQFVEMPCVLIVKQYEKSYSNCLSTCQYRRWVSLVSHTVYNISQRYLMETGYIVQRFLRYESTVLGDVEFRDLALPVTQSFPNTNILKIDFSEISIFHTPKLNIFKLKN